MRSVEVPSGCREWTGVKSKAGYGLAQWKDASSPSAHRIAWEVERGAIPEGMQVLHRCDNPSCVLVDHLFLGTVRDNMVDMASKGRQRGPRGVDHWKAKLDAEAVLAIRADPRSLRQTAAAYGIDYTVVSKIRRGTMWRHVVEA